MHLLKELNTSNLRIEIYSLNPDLPVDVDSSLFEGMSDQEIQDVAFNQIGADQVHISNNAAHFANPRSYATI